jgi:hypothetical protein
MPEVLHKVLWSDIVYNGDYHSMAQAQRIPLRILRHVVGRRSHITLAVETVRTDDQGKLDRFMTGGITETEFLKAIDYDETWGFPWEHYRELFVFARQHGIRVVGINTEPNRGRWVLKRRDQEAAKVVARELLQWPGGLVYVFDGDLHVATCHLPAAVNKLLSEFGVNPRTTVIYQNSEHIYWELAKNMLEQETEVLLLGENRFCIINTSPVIKFQSYLNWIDKTRELASPSLPTLRSDSVGEEGLYDQILHLVDIIAQFMEIEADGLQDFLVYSPADLDFLDRLRIDIGLSPEEIRTIASHIRSNESCFIEKGNIIYIANLSINHAAEEAAHFIHTVCAGPGRCDISQAEDFYCRVMREALGFFGSKIVNPKRPCYEVHDFKNLRKTYPGKAPDRIQHLQMIGRLFRRHKRYERNFLSKGKPWGLRGSMYELPLPLHLGVTHAVGYDLGNRLFKGMLEGVVTKGEIRNLFYVDFATLEQSLTTYLDLLLRFSRAGA